MVILALSICVLYGWMKVFRCDTLIVSCWCFMWAASSTGAIFLQADHWWSLSWLTFTILSFTLFLGVGTFFGGGCRNHNFEYLSTPPWNRWMTVKVHWKIVLICALPSYFSVDLLLSDLGVDYKVFGSVENLVTAAAGASTARYAEGFNPSLLPRALNSMVFLSGFIMGWYVSRKDAPMRLLLSLVSFIPPLIWTLLLTTKATFLFWLVFFVAGYVAFGNCKANIFCSNRAKLIFACASLLVAAVMLGTQLSRRGAVSLDEAIQVAEILAVAGFGHMYALGQWIDESLIWLPQSMGVRSFSGVFELFGMTTRAPGIYLDNVKVGESYTNVYSALRSLIEDFGFPIACCSFVALGWIGAKLERGVSPLARALLAIGIAWIFWSPFGSLFVYNSTFFACALLVVLSLLLRKPQSVFSR